MGALYRHKHVSYEVAGQRKASPDNSIHEEVETMSQIFLFLLSLKQQKPVDIILFGNIFHMFRSVHSKVKYINIAAITMQSSPAPFISVQSFFVDALSSEPL